MSQTQAKLEWMHPAPPELIDIATSYARKLNLHPLEADAMPETDIMLVLLDIAEGNLQHNVYREDSIYIIHAWDSDLAKDYLIVHRGLWVLGWVWK